MGSNSEMYNDAILGVHQYYFRWFWIIKIHSTHGIYPESWYERTFGMEQCYSRKYSLYLWERK